MKQSVFCCLTMIFLILGLAGCGSTPADSEEMTDSVASFSSTTMSEEEYHLIRQIFVMQYRSTMASLQQQITNFSNSDSWWEQTENLEKQASSAATSFLENASLIPDSQQQDFNNIQTAISSYEQAMNTLNTIRGASSADQQSRLSEAANQMMQANSSWNQLVE